MAYTFYKAMGLETGKSLVEEDRVEMAKDLMDRAGTRIIAAPRRRGCSVARAARGEAQGR